MHVCGKRFDPPPLSSPVLGTDPTQPPYLHIYASLKQRNLPAADGLPPRATSVKTGYPLRNRKGAAMSSRGRFYRAHVPVPTLLPPSTNSYLRDLGDGARREIRRSARVLSALMACGSHSNFGRRVLSLNLNRHNPGLDFNFVSTFCMCISSCYVLLHQPNERSHDLPAVPSLYHFASSIYLCLYIISLLSFLILTTHIWDHILLSRSQLLIHHLLSISATETLAILLSLIPSIFTSFSVFIARSWGAVGRDA